MHILMVADGRSPITKAWIRDLIATGYEVSLVSSYPCEKPHAVRDLYILPVGFSQFGGAQVSSGNGDKSALNFHPLLNLLKKYRSRFLALRYWVAPLSLAWYQPQLRRLIRKIVPDVVHALRIPYEGMLSLATPINIPLVVSIWGNDLTLHAPKNFLMRSLTRRVLQRADALITDVQRDLALAKKWGFDLETKPNMVALTSGGIDLAVMASIQYADTDKIIGGIPENCPVIINPRGIRPGYVRNDTFFAAIPIFLRLWQGDVLFVCPSMAGQPQAEQWVSDYGISRNVRLLPFLSQQQLWMLFKRSVIMTSITTHDGTPNSLLESISLGSFPIVGDIESLREWVVDGENGLLVNPDDAEALAHAWIRALKDDELRKNAGIRNLELLRQKADRNKMRSERDRLYSQIRNHPEF